MIVGRGGTVLVSATCVDTLDTDISGYQGDPPPGTMGSTMRALWTLLFITTQTLLDTAGHCWTLLDTGGARGMTTGAIW